MPTAPSQLTRGGTVNSGINLLEQRVRDRVRASGVDPVNNRAQFLELVTSTVQEADAASLLGNGPAIPDTERAIKHLVDIVAGLGELQVYMDDPSVEEIWINAPDKVFVARNGIPELTPLILAPGEIARLVEHMLSSSGRRLDLSNPFVDAMLPGGERLHVVIPDITRSHYSVNIRKFVSRANSLLDLVARGMLTHQAARFLDLSVRAGLNVLVAGATGAGKTTFLRALAAAIPASERVVTVEEVFELNLPSRDVVAMQCRSANLEGNGEISLRRLVKESLRMRPDRIIVGEVREAEALDLLIALNSGIPGLATIHANSAREAVIKASTLPLLAGENVTASFVNPTVASALDLVVHLRRERNGARVVGEIAGVSGRVENGHIESASIFQRTGDGLVRGSGLPPKEELFERLGIDLSFLLGQEAQWAS